jgi:uncharacterized membrane protein
METRVPQKTMPISRDFNRWLWLAIAIVLGLVVALFGARIIGLYWLYWGSDPFKKILYEDAGLSDAWASTLAITLSFFYAIALVHLLGRSTWKVLAGKADARQMIISFACYFFVFALPHLIHGIASSWQSPDQCFNQRTGEPTKWYAVMTNGGIVLFDSPGYDKFGIKKQPATREVCEIFDRQRVGGQPKKIIQDPRNVHFFDPRTGVASVWYSGVGSDIRFYDADGFDPINGQRLHPVTADIVSEARDRATRVELKPIISAAVPRLQTQVPQLPTASIPYPRSNNSELTSHDEMHQESLPVGTFQFQVCNKTPASVAVAIMGREIADMRDWVIKGWMQVAPGECRPGGRFLKGTFFVTAHSRIQRWGTAGITFCLERGPFRRVHNSPQACLQREQLINFEKRSIQNDVWTWNLG